MAQALTSIVPPADDCLIEQGFDRYTDKDHAIWRTLFERQSRMLPDRACREFLDGLDGLGVTADGIPDFRNLSDILGRTTGWEVVPVAGLVPDDVFFWHLANRRFPASNWVRQPDRMDYLPEPDVFHDVFGHVPVLMNPMFADYMQAYGRGGLKALRLGALDFLARLYWYTVEFGLIRSDQGLRIYGSGIVSSRTESVYCLEDPTPNRIAFDLLRIMRTNYRIDNLQAVYFVIDDFEQLFDATRPDFTPYYKQLKEQTDYEPETLTDADRVLPPNPAR